MPGPYGCTICLPGTLIPWASSPATDRQKIAALCNHLMAVHGAGPRDAWAEALLVYPVTARAWEQEVLAAAVPV